MASQDLNHGTIKLSRGTAAHIWRPQQSPYKAIVVLQHGYAEYAERYITSHHNIINHLVSANYIVYAMDMWGHGSSPGTRGIVHIGKAIQDHQELRRLAHDQNPNLPIILFGHSLGGLVTAGSTTADPTHIKSVLLTGPALVEPLPYAARLAVGVISRVIPKWSVPGRKGALEGLTRDTSEIAKFRDDLLVHNDAISFLLAATALDAMQGIAAGMGEWTVPTMVLHGNMDSYCDWKASEKFVKGIRSEDKTFGVYEEGRHELLHDLEGDAVLERVLGWIGGHI
ncbi:alpha/beta-hydrolase [Ophiobolus disseminans]|uniref:Alpha/beta-hydrolase n=1 Tax=Ophiobolus disseminans TaxID=1469910 RepID=A0A6A6ZNJ7_9PLEO|nr:alpha/beta-hydrolase [Ophiobolus disseminans]